MPVIPEAKTFASMGLVPGGSYTNQRFCSKHLEVDSSVDPILLDIMSDPQTSGGLLISVPKAKLLPWCRSLRKEIPCSQHYRGRRERSAWNNPMLLG